MALTNVQIKTLAKKMNFDDKFNGCFFKDDLPKLEFNKCYVVNLEDEFDEDGERNIGSHWCGLQINKYPNETIQGMWMDPYGVGPPVDVINAIKKLTEKKLLTPKFRHFCLH